MIDPIPISVKSSELDGALVQFTNINFTDDAKIRFVKTAGEIDFDHYCILNFLGMKPEEVFGGWIGFANTVDELWVGCLETKIALKRLGVKKPIFILTEDSELLSYCMKDRLASIQDRINKWKEKVANP